MSKLAEQAPERPHPRENAKSVLQPLLRRRLRWLRRRTVQRLADFQNASCGSWEGVPLARVAKCGRVAWTDQVSVHGVQGDDGLCAYPVGVVSCGSVWSCAVCSAKIAARRSMEVEAAALAHTAAGGELVMLTLTVRHDRSQGLAELLDALRGAWRSVQNDRRWLPVRSELVGSITATEITRGPNGWHPHLHLLLFVPGGGAGAAALSDLGEWLPEAWRVRVAARLGGSGPDLAHGVHVKQLDAGAAAYVSKIADETTRADLKSDSRSVWALLDAVDDGETWAIAAFVEFFRATKGRRAIVWSRGLKARFGIGELSDEEIAAREVGGLVLDVVPSDRWLSWCRSLTSSGVVVALAHLESLEARGIVADPRSASAAATGAGSGPASPATQEAEFSVVVAVENVSLVAGIGVPSGKSGDPPPPFVCGLLGHAEGGPDG